MVCCMLVMWLHIVLTHPHHSHTQVCEYLNSSNTDRTMLPDQGVTYLYGDTVYSLHCGRVGHNHGYHIQVVYCTPYHTSVMIPIPEVAINKEFNIPITRAVRTYLILVLVTPMTSTILHFITGFEALSTYILLCLF